ncbi:MAG: hypothetical protein GY866_02450 [Proteobacteria bacterium]|nr:hypothetical protein [Pseudomonadota bacterium]
MVLLNDLLDLSKLELSEVDYRMEEIDMCRLVHDTVVEYTTTLNDKGVALLVADPEVKTRIVCDAHKMKQVVRNLLSNALKFTRPCRKITVFLRSAPASARPELADEGCAPSLVIEVMDEGIGIPEEELDSIFVE